MKYKLVSTFLEKTLPFLALLILWETGSRLNLLNNSFFSSPVGIFGVLFESNFWKIFFADFLSTLTRLILGFFFGYGFANLLIFAGFYNRFLLNFFKQINSVIRYLPIPVVIPLAILAFGLTDSSKILVISFSVFIVYFAYLVQVLNKEEKNYKVLQISLNTTPFSRFKDFYWLKFNDYIIIIKKIQHSIFMFFFFRSTKFCYTNIIVIS